MRRRENSRFNGIAKWQKTKREREREKAVILISDVSSILRMNSLHILYHESNPSQVGPCTRRSQILSRNAEVWFAQNETTEKPMDCIRLRRQFPTIIFALLILCLYMCTSYRTWIACCSCIRSGLRKEWWSVIRSRLWKESWTIFES